MKRYSILAVQRDGLGEAEVLQVDANPKGVAEALASKMIPGKSHLTHYTSVRIRDNHETADA